jgi:hypothetical protein
VSLRKDLEILPLFEASPSYLLTFLAHKLQRDLALAPEGNRERERMRQGMEKIIVNLIQKKREIICDVNLAAMVPNNCKIQNTEATAC